MAAGEGTSSSRVAADSSTEPRGPHDLLIVGPGAVGRLVAQQWKKEYPDCQIVGQTFTTDHDAELTALGIIPSLKVQGKSLPQKFPYVIFCDPPQTLPHVNFLGNSTRDAFLNWKGTKGSFLLISSSSVYKCNDNGPCKEDDDTVPLSTSPETESFLKAELIAKMADGCVLRLADLYDADRGLHIDWLNQGKVDLRPDHIHNFIHYEDAASLAVAILKSKFISKIFLGCDNHPLTRQEIMDLVNRSGKYHKKFDCFTGTVDQLGKKLNNSETRAALGWEPKYPCFLWFLMNLET